MRHRKIIPPYVRYLGVLMHLLTPRRATPFVLFPVNAASNATYRNPRTGAEWLSPDSFDLRQAVWLWSSPPETSSTDALGGGITYAIHPQFCDPLLGRFSEQANVVLTLLGVSFLDCSSIHRAVVSAVNTWQINHKLLHFEDVTKECSNATYIGADGRPTCDAAELMIMTDVNVNAGGALQADPAGRAAWVEVDASSYDQAPYVTSGVQLPYGFGFRKAHLTLATDICWYLDTTFCYFFHSLYASGVQVELMMSLILAIGLSLSALFIVWTIVNFSRAIIHPHKRKVGPDFMKDVFGPKTDSGLIYCSHMPTLGLLMALFFVLTLPSFHFAIYVPCWECFDFKATMAHEIGHVLGFDHPDTKGLLNLELTTPVGPATCNNSLGHVARAAVPDGYDSIMFSTTAHRQRTCLTQDDLDGLNSLYPSCEGAVTEVLCVEERDLSGFLRFAISIGFPFGCATIAILLLQAIVKYFMLRKDVLEEKLMDDLRDQKKSLSKQLRTMASALQRAEADNEGLKGELDDAVELIDRLKKKKEKSSSGSRSEEESLQKGSPKERSIRKLFGRSKSSNSKKLSDEEEKERAILKLFGRNKSSTSKSSSRSGNIDGNDTAKLGKLVGALFGGGDKSRVKSPNLSPTRSNDTTKAGKLVGALFGGGDKSRVKSPNMSPTRSSARSLSRSDDLDIAKATKIVGLFGGGGRLSAKVGGSKSASRELGRTGTRWTDAKKLLPERTHRERLSYRQDKIAETVVAAFSQRQQLRAAPSLFDELPDELLAIAAVTIQSYYRGHQVRASGSVEPGAWTQRI